MFAQAANDVDDTKRVFEHLSAKIKDTAKTPEEIGSDLQAVLADVIGSSEGITRHQALMALCPKSDEYVLWQSGNDKISTIRGPSAVIGVGESSLTHYLLSTLLKPGTALASPQAAIYGIYVVKQAKKYIPGCGGPTDVVWLRPDGGTVVVPSLTVEAMERELDNFDYRASVMFSMLVDKRLDTPEITKVTEEFALFLKEAHGHFKML